MLHVFTDTLSPRKVGGGIYKGGGLILEQEDHDGPISLT